MAKGFKHGGGGMPTSGIPKFTYDGDFQVNDEGEKNWSISLLTSGTLIFDSTNGATDGIEVFLCGGGGHGGSGGSFGGGGGGGGGYTETKNFMPNSKSEYPVVIGGSGGITSAFGFTANPGTSGGGGSSSESYSAPGGSGTGSGGGGGMGSGGVPLVGYNGSDGAFAFGIEGTTKYGGGGGGGGGQNGENGNGGNGGASGGGNGGRGRSSGGSAGVANTGGGGGGGGAQAGGGAGGSGIVIIRNKRS